MHYYFTKNCNEYRFRINPYDPCVISKTIGEHQMTILWYVDDLKVSNKVGITNVKKYLSKIYGGIKVERSQILEILGMMLDYSIKGQVQGK